MAITTPTAHGEAHDHHEERSMKVKSGLAACIGVATAMGCLGAHADMTQDRSITGQVKSAFSKHPDVGTEISVMTKDGVVYLKGNTSTPLAKSHAEDLAKAVPGVQKVVDDIGTEK
jgi:osmotically-inducible protein OsmY